MITLTEQDLETLLGLERHAPGAAPAADSAHRSLLLALTDPDNLDAALAFVWARLDDPDPGLWALLQRLLRQLLAEGAPRTTLRRFHSLLGGPATLPGFRDQVLEDFLVWLYLHKEKLAVVPEKTTPRRFFHRLCKNLLADQARQRYRKTDEGWQPRQHSLEALVASETLDLDHGLHQDHPEPDDGSDPLQGLHIQAMDATERAEALAGARLGPRLVAESARAFLHRLACHPMAGKHCHRTPPDWALILLCCVRSALNPQGLRPSHVDPGRLPNVNNLLRLLGLVADLNRYADYHATLIGQWLFNDPRETPAGLGLGQGREAVRAAWAALQILADTARASYHYDSDAYRKPTPT